MPEQEPEKRGTNFEEVNLGLSKDAAIAEASRCIQCKNPQCVTGCPAGLKIPQFIKAVKDGKFDDGLAIMEEDSLLPAVCGRVCPQETQCEAKCVLGIRGEPVAIGYLERFLADHGKPGTGDGKPTGKKVAVIGSGPAGLMAASELAKKDYKVTVFEALHELGGVLRYGIPAFRMPKDILDSTIADIRTLGVEFRTDVVAGRTITVDELFDEGYEAVFIGSGAGAPMMLGIQGENLNGVMTANEFLTRCNLMQSYKFPEYDTPVIKARKVAVIGGGNVAMDSARCYKRLGADVTVVYRRTEKEMPARVEEVKHAKEEGIKFHFLTIPLEIKGESGWVKGIRCQATELKEINGKQRPVPIEGSEFEIEADAIVTAIGQVCNRLIQDTTKGIDTDEKSHIQVDANGKTSREGVFAGGDITTGAATVIQAIGAGKIAAAAMDEYLKNKQPD
ncbi:MAG: NADPH-dependent glutamate synthase [archaeon]